MKFLNSLIARIWGPFMLMAVLLTAMVGLYIPIQQAKTLREFQMSELEEVVKVMSNNISIAGQYDDWSNLNEVFNSASSRPSLEFSALILESNGISALVASNPPNINQQAIDEAAESPLLVRAPFRGGPFKGTVVILGSEAFIQAELTRLNTPLQFAMALILIAVIILYFFLRQKVSKPLRQVRAAAQQIGQGNLQGSKAYDAKIWELKSLNDALDMMRTGLLKERETNQALTKGMENEIKRQTKDLRKTLDELQDSRNLFGNVIESALDAMVIADGKSKIVEWNRKAELIFGWKREEAIGQTLSKLIIPHKHRDAHDNGMSHYHATGHGPVLNTSFQTQALRRNGDVFDIEIYITSLTIGNEEIFSSFIRDITDSKRLTSDLEEQRELNSALLNALPLMVTLKGEDLVYSFVNDRACEVLEKSREEMIGQREVDVFNTDWVEESTELDKRTWNGENTKPTEYALSTGDGVRHYLIGRYIISVGEQKPTTYLLTYGFEVSQLKAVQLQLQSALNTKDEFLATVSHEIRTPLHSIIVLAELLNDSSRRTEHSEFSTNIHSSSQHLLNLVNDILDFSKANAKKLELSPRRISLTEFFNGVSRTDTGSRSDLVSFRKTVLGCDGIYVEADNTRLNQVIQNLMSNALKFTEEGEVHLKVNAAQQGRNLILDCAVIDSGIGISKTDQDKILQAFEQANTGIARKFGGTGLGLGIVVQLLQLMGSKLEVNSSLGEGSTFSFQLSLPLADYNESLPSSPTKDPLESHDGLRVLYVEDILPNQMVMKAMCRPLNVQLTMASSGKEAIQKCQESSFDLILMDIQMPEMDGIETFKSLTNLPCFEEKRPQVHAFTAHADQNSMKRFLSMGFNGVLTKPLMPEQLNLLLSEFSSNESNDIP